MPEIRVKLMKFCVHIRVMKLFYLMSKRAMASENSAWVSLIDWLLLEP